MGVYVAITCDTDDCPAGDPHTAFADHTARAAYGPGMVTTHDVAVARARNSSWTRIDGKWFCPVCSKRN